MTQKVNFVRVLKMFWYNNWHVYDAVINTYKDFITFSLLQ